MKTSTSILLQYANWLFGLTPDRGERVKRFVATVISMLFFQSVLSELAEAVRGFMDGWNAAGGHALPANPWHLSNGASFLITLLVWLAAYGYLRLMASRKA